VGKQEEKRTLGRPRVWWVGNIKMDLTDIELGGIDWIDLTHDRDRWMAFVNTVINLRAL
jgi:hypothetical protein